MLTKGDDLSAVSTRLDAMLRLLIEGQQETRAMTVGDKILVLMDSGLSQTEAGRVLGVDSNQIPSYLNDAKNRILYNKVKRKTKASKSK